MTVFRRSLRLNNCGGILRQSNCGGIPFYGSCMAEAEAAFLVLQLVAVVEYYGMRNQNRTKHRNCARRQPFCYCLRCLCGDRRSCVMMNDFLMSGGSMNVPRLNLLLAFDFSS